MALWGCQINSRFLDCAGVMYTSGERALLGAIAVVFVSIASYTVIRLASPR